MEKREFEMGKLYRFTEVDKGEEFAIFLFESENETHYRGKIVETNVERFEPFIGKSNTSFWKSGKVIRFWDAYEISAEPDYYGKNIRLNYKDPEVIDLWIDMALATGDKRWFKLLARKKQEVSA